jgi:hypothetical protein
MQDAHFRGYLMNAAALNHAQDEMDAMMPFGQTGGRIPVAAMAMAFQKGSSVNNHITVTNSQIGLINTGDVQKIDAAITLTAGSDAEAVGKQLQALTQAVIDSSEVAADQKRELVELLQALSDQVVRSRTKSVALSLLTAIEERAKGVNALVQLVASLNAGVSALFGSP